VKPTETPIWRFLGINTQGDLGPITFYTARGRRLVFYFATTPKKPPTSRQRVQRELLRAVAACWQQLSPAEKALWNAAAEKARLRIHGYNAFAYCHLRHDYAWYATLCRQSHTTPPLSHAP